MVDLKCCPFCGGEPVAYEGKFSSSVKCDNGHAIHEYKPTLAEAVAAWNTRADADTLASQARQIEALREALDAVAFEAERENGGWVHLKRVIAIKARATLEETSRG